MRIACDLDGVLADLHSAFARAALEMFPELDRAVVGSPQVAASPPAGDASISADASVAPPSATFDLALSPSQSHAIWKRLLAIENFWETLGEIEPGMISRLASMADERRWEILFVTSRPVSKGRTLQRQTQRWLQAYGFPLPSAYVVHGSRGQIAKALQIDVVIDDRAENCLDVVLDSEAGAILVWRGSPETIPGSAARMGIAVVPTVAECLDALVAIEHPDEGGLLERLRRFFGLRITRAKRAP